MHSGADEIVGIIKEAGVNVVFGIPSIHNIRLYETLRKEPSIHHILCRQETMAAHMADGYARAGHRLGVVISSTGPGSGYMVPALQEAWGSCSSVLMITTNIPTSKLGQGLGVLHELEDQDALFRCITKATISVRSENEVQAFTQEAINTALSGRPGPVYLEVPTDLLDRPISRGGERALEKKEKGEAISGLKEALLLLRRAKQPLLVVGLGATHSDVAKHISTLAETLAAPVMTTTNSKGAMAEDHPLAFGNVTRKGVFREIVQSCDITLSIGSRLREVDAKRRGLVFSQLIHVDWDDQWVNRNFPAEVTLIGDIPSILKALLDGLERIPPSDERRVWIKEMRKRMEKELNEIREAHLEMQYLDVIRGSLSRESALVIDNTQLGYWAEYFYPSYCPRGLIAPRGSGTIGFAFAAAIGVKTACPEKSVLALIGDGGFLYSAQELATCMRHKIGFPVIVINDNAYGVIGFLQRSAYQKAFESDLTNPDFVSLARAYGAQATRVDSPADLGASLEKALASKDLWVIELVAPSLQPPFPRY
ncbi:MAG: thiamine pyrophosphate-binding protein [Deltaproteobacteria bacterium]|nr:MAG: thiamine pyrophosphate-binding protein [Deltaproteobacteria bacterium]